MARQLDTIERRAISCRQQLQTPYGAQQNRVEMIEPTMALAGMCFTLGIGMLIGHAFGFARGKGGRK